MLPSTEAEWKKLAGTSAKTGATVYGGEVPGLRDVERFTSLAEVARSLEAPGGRETVVSRPDPYAGASAQQRAAWSDPTSPLYDPMYVANLRVVRAVGPVVETPERAPSFSAGVAAVRVAAKGAVDNAATKARESFLGTEYELGLHAGKLLTSGINPATTAKDEVAALKEAQDRRDPLAGANIAQKLGGAIAGFGATVVGAVIGAGAPVDEVVRGAVVNIRGEPARDHEYAHEYRRALLARPPVAGAPADAKADGENPEVARYLRQAAREEREDKRNGGEPYRLGVGDVHGSSTPAPRLQPAGPPPSPAARQAESRAAILARLPPPPPSPSNGASMIPPALGTPQAKLTMTAGLPLSIAQKALSLAQSHPLAVGAAGATILGAGAAGIALAADRRSAKRSSKKRSSKKAARKPLKRKASGKTKRKATAKRTAKGGKRRREDRSGVTRSTYKGSKVYRAKNGTPYIRLKNGRVRFIPQ